MADSMGVQRDDQPSSTDTDNQNFILFEYDMNNMYYHLDKQQVWTAAKKFLTMVRSEFRRRCVAVSKFSRTEDRMGSGSGKFYSTFTLNQLQAFIHCELFLNHYGRFGYVSFEQRIGVPMGGAASAQLASLMFFMRDMEYRHSLRLQGFSYFRYRDNLPGILDTRKTSLTSVKQLLTAIYGMELKLEDSGDRLQTLEMTLYLSNNVLSHELKPQLYDHRAGGPLDKMHKVPPFWSSGRPSYLRTVIPSILRKCVAYGSSEQWVKSGILNAFTGLVLGDFTVQEIGYRFLRVASNIVMPAYVTTYLSFLLTSWWYMYPDIVPIMASHGHSASFPCSSFPVLKLSRTAWVETHSL